MKTKLSKTTQSGTAIIMALFVVALVTAICTLLIEHFYIDMRRLSLVKNANQAYLIAQGSIDWAIDRLNDNMQKSQPNQLADKTPIQSPVDHDQGVSISSSIYDAQGYFNLNNLIDPEYQIIFKRLISIVAPEIDSEKAATITDAIVDWISPVKNIALEEYYLKQTPSYQAPHRLMISVSELRLVKDISAAVFLKLSPFIFALPETTPININNAAIPLLMSLSPTMSENAAKSIVSSRTTAPFATVSAFVNFDTVKNNLIDPTKIIVKSNYFLVQTNVTVEKQYLTLYTLLERSGEGTKPKTTVLWQSKGTL